MTERPSHKTTAGDPWEMVYLFQGAAAEWGEGGGGPVQKRGHFGLPAQPPQPTPTGSLPMVTQPSALLVA